MPVSCSAYGCTNRFSKEKKIQFFGFPKNPEKLQSWLNRMRREDWTPTKYSKICSDHFLSSDYLLRPRLKDNAVPSVFTGFPKHLQRTVTPRKSPKKRTFESDIANVSVNYFYVINILRLLF
ncbi:hypothetical protein RI129_002954 [Pyrocoelia pectoralis]|uniref:THAP-type domain-containing protein n=1 Tax=Pyrocoelia pectoralis TaxID=417401 RepID=A0AAN7ZM40_9COLE